MQKPKLVAVDSNVLILLAQGDDLTIDARQTIEARLKPAQFIAAPTVIRELMHKVFVNAPVIATPLEVVKRFYR